jgi:hypothetical protein
VLDEAYGGHGEKGIAELLDDLKGSLFMCIETMLLLKNSGYCIVEFEQSVIVL